jgi:hypothetical protein
LHCPLSTYFRSRPRPIRIFRVGPALHVKMGADAPKVSR